jgi:predicted dehydrogenase
MPRLDLSASILRCRTEVFAMIRRSFLRHTGAAASAAWAFPTIVSATALPRAGRVAPNDRIQVGFIGLGGRARSILRDEWVPEAQVVAAADCDRSRLQSIDSVVPDAANWHKHQDYRRMLEAETLDAVFVETTTHARVLIAIGALQSGRDVYAEKPVSLTIAEGRALVRWVEKTGRILQVGSQQRSMPINQFASRLARDGALGRVSRAITFNYLPALPYLPRASRPIPEGLDWDAWCNQTPLRPYHPSIQLGWGQYFDYDGGGQSWGVSGWGTHGLDQAQAALGTDQTGPVEVIPQNPADPAGPVILRYADDRRIELTGARRGYEDLGAIIEGERGTLDIRRGSVVASDPQLLTGAPPDSPSVRAGETTPHLLNFFACLRSRQQPNAPAETGHRATSLCHLVNIARTLGRKLEWDPAAEVFPHDAEANEFLTRPRRAGYELPEIG